MTFQNLAFGMVLTKTDEDFVSLFCNQIRKFVAKHTTLSLVEFAVEDPNAGEYLASVFPGVDSRKCKGKGQPGTRLRRERQTRQGKSLQT